MTKHGRLAVAICPFLAHGESFGRPACRICASATEYDAICRGDLDIRVICGAWAFKFGIPGIETHGASCGCLEDFELRSAFGECEGVSPCPLIGRRVAYDPVGGYGHLVFGKRKSARSIQACGDCFHRRGGGRGSKLHRGTGLSLWGRLGRGGSGS